MHADEINSRWDQCSEWQWRTKLESAWIISTATCFLAYLFIIDFDSKTSEDFDLKPSWLSASSSGSESEFELLYERILSMPQGSKSNGADVDAA